MACSGGALQWGRWRELVKAKVAQPIGIARRVAAPGVVAGQVDVVPGQRPDVGEDLVGYIVPMAAQGEDGLAKVAAVPEHDGGDEQVQAAGTVQLAFVGAVADLPEPVEEDGLAEVVAGLALFRLACIS